MRKLWQFSIFALLVGCGGATIVGSLPSAQTPGARAQRYRGTSPSELLYVFGGAVSIKHPYIEVLNAQDRSPDQKPLYTIDSLRGGNFNSLAVDASDTLYTTNLFANGVELDVFLAGQRKPEIQCSLDAKPVGLYLAGKVLYVPTRAYTIREYALPLKAGKTCPQPTRILTDQIAKLRARFFLSVAVDPDGNIFDTWLAGTEQEAGHIDEFPAGSLKARRYAPSGFGGFMASDSRGNLIADYSSVENQDYYIEIFAQGAHKATFYDGIPGAYMGIAFGAHDDQLFISRDYPSTGVDVFAYDRKAAKLGKLLYSVSSGIWRYAQSIAVFSKG